MPGQHLHLSAGAASAVAPWKLLSSVGPAQPGTPRSRADIRPRDFQPLSMPASSSNATTPAAFRPEPLGGASRPAKAAVFPDDFHDLHASPRRPSPKSTSASLGLFDSQAVPHNPVVTATFPCSSDLRIDVSGSSAAAALSKSTSDPKHISAPSRSPNVGPISSYLRDAKGPSQDDAFNSTRVDMSFTQSISEPTSAPRLAVYPQPFPDIDSLYNASSDDLALALASPITARHSCDSDSTFFSASTTATSPDMDALGRTPSINSRKRSQDSLDPPLPGTTGSSSKSPRLSDRASRTSSMRSVDWKSRRDSSSLSGLPWLGGEMAIDPEDEEGSEPGFAGPGKSFSVADAPTAATPEAFHAHVRSVNPALEPFMVRRVTSEQIKRYKRLIDFKAQHESHVGRGSCPSGDRCSVLGKGPDYSLSSFVRRPSDAPLALFHIVQPDGAPFPDDGLDRSSSIPASFPEGIPLPPVSRLPAIVECPLCFQVKKFMKPSDWTKHVHEDVQPFTCTFPNCAEPKSFKRKADWVRHESERHRHLESWRCDVQECWHVCYRKDNFVQHLVREHRLPEPRAKSAKGGAPAKARPDEDIVSRLVEKCRVESAKQSAEEPCRFCGTVCDSWKELTVHLAKHMEQISMPILELAGHSIPRIDVMPLRPRKISGDPFLSKAQPRISITSSSSGSPSTMPMRAVSATPLLQSGSDSSFMALDSGSSGQFLDMASQMPARSRSAHEPSSFQNASPFNMGMLSPQDTAAAIAAATSAMYEPLLANTNAADMNDFGFNDSAFSPGRGLFDFSADMYDSPTGVFGGTGLASAQGPPPSVRQRGSPGLPDVGDDHSWVTRAYAYATGTEGPGAGSSSGSAGGREGAV